MDKIDNLSLIENCLIHLQFELSMKTPSYFRIAKEAHLLLYRSMIEALRGTANFAITGRNKDRIYKYKKDNKPWQEIHKVKFECCKKAWRFSQPIHCEEPKYNPGNLPNTKNADYLISFYDALAMIQTEHFMLQYIHSISFPLSDVDIKIFEWLHESIRNEYEHFVPKIYLSPIQDLVYAAKLCIDLSKKLLFDSGNVIFYSVSTNKLEELFGEIIKVI